MFPDADDGWYPHMRTVCGWCGRDRLEPHPRLIEYEATQQKLRDLALPRHPGPRSRAEVIEETRRLAELGA